MKVLVYYSKGFGQPDYIRVSEVLPSGALTKQGIMYKVDKLPGKPAGDRFEIEVTGNFEVTYQWRDYRGEWHQCDEGKYKWCLEKKKHAERVYTYKAD